MTAGDLTIATLSAVIDRRYSTPHTRRRYESAVRFFDFHYDAAGKSLADGASEKLPAGHGSHAAQSRSRRLAELEAHGQRMGFQSAEPDQPAERPSTAARMVVVDGRYRRAGSDTARLRRHHVPAKPARRHSGAGRCNRRLDL